MRPIRNSLWFNANAEEAAQFYATVFPNAEVTGLERYTEAGPGTPGSVVTVTWRIGATEFVGINGGPVFSFTPAISFVVACDDQAELDRTWDALLAGGGKPSMCGWLEDRFGVSWQVIPAELPELIRDPKARGHARDGEDRPRGAPPGGRPGLSSPATGRPTPGRFPNPLPYSTPRRFSRTSWWSWQIPVAKPASLTAR